MFLLFYGGMMFLSSKEEWESDFLFIIAMGSDSESLNEVCLEWSREDVNAEKEKDVDQGLLSGLGYAARLWLSRVFQVPSMHQACSILFG